MGIKNIERIVNEIDKCLDKDLMFPALFMALSLPDLCGKDKWNELSQNYMCHERYTRWFNKYVDYELNPLKYHFPNSEPVMSFGAEECYKLRCALLHAGDTDIGTEIKVDSFVIETDSCVFSGSLMRSGNDLKIKNNEFVDTSYIYIRAIVLVRAILIGTRLFMKEQNENGLV